jgi:hypothetical protein
MQRNSSSMSVPRPVSGSKPRKHITKISYDNPSLYKFTNIGYQTQ